MFAEKGKGGAQGGAVRKTSWGASSNPTYHSSTELLLYVGEGSVFFLYTPYFLLLRIFIFILLLYPVLR